MVRIRLKRMGKKNAPSYRVVVADSRSPRDGKNIEIVGFYDPINSQEKINLERAEYWIAKGAQPSETCADIIRRAKTGEATCGKKQEIRDKAAAAAKAEAEAEAKAKAEEEAAAAKAAEAEAEESADAEAEETVEG